MHRQLVGAGGDEGAQRQRTEHRPHLAAPELGGVRAGEELGDVVPRGLQGREHLGPGCAASCLEHGLVVGVLVEGRGAVVGPVGGGQVVVLGLLAHPLQ